MWKGHLTSTSSSPLMPSPTRSPIDTPKITTGRFAPTWQGRLRESSGLRLSKAKEEPIDYCQSNCQIQTGWTYFCVKAEKILFCGSI